MKNNTKKKIIILVLLTFLFTGCTQQLYDKDNKIVKNPDTDQSLTGNILCRPTDEKTKELYTNAGVDLEKYVECDKFTPLTGGDDGLWETIFVKPLAFVILWVSQFVNSSALAIIIVTLLIRLIAYPLTNKTAMQSELIKKAQPELDKLERKYANKNDQESIMKKSQEMTMIYKKYNINPLTGCLFAFIQLPLFFAFLEAINRLPVIFEENFLLMQMGTNPWNGIFKQQNYIYLILVVIIGLTTYLSMRMNSTSSTEGQNPMKSMTTIMSVMIIVMSFFMPTALGIYWSASNIFTMIQNIIVKRSKVLNG